MNELLFSLSNVTVGYRKDSPILTDVHLQVQNKEMIAITGKNGSGKSTLIRTICRLQKPLSGTMHAKDPLRVSLVPQLKKINLTYPMSVETILKLPIELESPLFKKVLFSESQIDILDRLGILNLRNKLLRECSGGQVQKVLLARSLLSPSDLILLDEPLDALDWKARELVFQILLEKVASSNVSLLIITHNLEKEWESHFTKLLVTEEGRLKEGSFGKSH